MADQTCIQSQQPPPQPQLLSAPLLPPPPPPPQPVLTQPVLAGGAVPASPDTVTIASGKEAVAAGQINLTATPAPAPLLPNHVSSPPVPLLAGSETVAPKLDNRVHQSLNAVAGTAVDSSSPSPCITAPSPSSSSTSSSTVCIVSSPIVATPAVAAAPTAVTTITTSTTTPSAPPTVQTAAAVTTCVAAAVTTSTTTMVTTTTAVTGSGTAGSSTVVPVTTAKRVILTAHTQPVLNAPIRASSHFISGGINASTGIPIASPSSKSQLPLVAAPSLPNGNVSSPVLSAGISGSSPSVTTPTVNVPLVTRSHIVTGNQSAIQSSPSPSSSSSSSSVHAPVHPVVLQTGSSPAIITNNGPVAGVKQPLLTSPAATSGLLSNHQLVLNNSAGNKLQAQPAPAGGQPTVIFTTHDGQKTVMAIPSSAIVNQGLVPGSPAGARVLPPTNSNNNNNVISSGTTTVLLGKPVQSQPNLQTHLTPATGQPQQQQQQQQQQHQQQPQQQAQQQQIHHPQQQQVVVSNPQMQQQMQPQMVHIRTPSGQIMQLTPQQQQGLQRQLAPRPNFVVAGNGPLRLQSPVRPGQQPVHPQGGGNFRPGAPTNCVLIRTEHGYQLLNIAPQPGLPPGQPPIRFTVPVSSAAGQVQQQMGQVRQQIVNISTQPQIRTGMPQQQPHQPQQQQQQQLPQPQPQMSQPLSVQTAQANSQASAANSQSQMSPNTAKRKCKNFLSTLIRLATDQPVHVAENVRKLIQGLIDGNIIPEDFTNQLQRELNSSPQPCLIPFLKKSLPHLKQSLMLGELTIEGVNPPPRTPLNQPQIPLQRSPAGIRFMTTTQPLTFPAGAIVQTQQQPPQQQQQQRPQMTPQMQVAASAAPPLPAPAPVTPAPKAKSKAKPRASTTPKDKDKKISTSLREDDDINDVAAMGGVNLAEENQRMAAAANEVGTQIRSCKDETFFLTNTLASKISRLTAKFSLEDPSTDVISLISHAAQERIKTLVERLGVIAEHRLEVFKVDPKYEVAQDVRSQIKFLEELDKMEKRRHEEQEREMLLKAAKSRSKLEDPEQLKLKQKAKEMQRAEMEEARQREANETALLAIGPRKKLKLDSTPSSTSTPSAAAGSSNLTTGNSITGSAGSAGGINFTPFNNSTPSNHFNSIYSTPFSSSKGPMRRMTKRVYMKDLLFLMEQDRSTSKSAFLYKSYTK